MNYAEIRNRIKELKDGKRTPLEIHIQLMQEGINISYNFVYLNTRETGKDYEIVCKTCKKTVYYKYPRKHCYECKDIKVVKEENKVAKKNYKKHVLNISEMMEKTQEVTGLEVSKIKKLLQTKTHSEIRAMSGEIN